MNYSHLIDKYFDNDLNAEEKKIFEEKYKSDPEFAATVDELKAFLDLIREFHLSTTESFKYTGKYSRIFKQVDDAIEKYGSKPDDRYDQELAEYKEKVKASFEQPREKFSLRNWFKRLSFWQITILPVSVAILVIILCLTGPSNDRLFNEYYSLFNPHLITRGSEEFQILDAAHYYHTHQFEKALQELQSLNTDDPRYSLGLMMKAFCLIETGDISGAIVVFESAPFENELKDYARWNLALCYLKIGDTDKSKELLQEIATGNVRWYATRANELLEEID